MNLPILGDLAEWLGGKKLERGDDCCCAVLVPNVLGKALKQFEETAKPPLCLLLIWVEFTLLGIERGGVMHLVPLGVNLLPIRPHPTSLSQAIAQGHSRKGDVDAERLPVGWEISIETYATEY
ncbi:MAG: hypothetical protein F6K00_21615 [Leptolyngbya sp. SIOISBB]|nr:hypothetical protein [Leptolyngbya sp. SIOISBB]